MTETDVEKISKFNNYTIRSSSTAGTIYLHIMEVDNKPVKIMCSAGKCGSEFSAFATGICNMASTMLQAGLPIIKVISNLSEIVTDKVVRDTDGVNVGSGVAGINNALLKYIRAKQEEVKVKNYEPRMDQRHKRAG